MLYPWSIVTVPVNLPKHTAATQLAVTVTASGAGPHDVSTGGLTVRLILGSLVLVWKTTSETFGAHFTDSPTLPELRVTSPLWNVMVTGLVDQIAFGAVSEAKPTAA